MGGDQLVLSNGPKAVTADEYGRWFTQDHAARFIVSSVGRIRAANPAAKAFVAAGLVHADVRGCLVLPRENGHRRHTDLIASAARRGATQRRAFQIGPDHWLVAAAQRDRLDADQVFVSLRDVKLSTDPDLAAIADSFGISESERPILRGLAQAMCPKEVARESNLSIHTVRAHLRSIYGKMGVRSQTEAQRILTRISASVEST